MNHAAALHSVCLHDFFIACRRDPSHYQSQSHVMRSPTAISEFFTLLTNTHLCSRSSRNGSRPRSGTLWLRILYMLERPPAHPPIRLLIGGRAPLPGAQLRRPLGEERYTG